MDEQRPGEDAAPMLRLVGDWEAGPAKPAVAGLAGTSGGAERLFEGQGCSTLRLAGADAADGDPPPAHAAGSVMEAQHPGAPAPAVPVPAYSQSERRILRSVLDSVTDLIGVLEREAAASASEAVLARIDGALLESSGVGSMSQIQAGGASKAADAADQNHLIIAHRRSLQLLRRIERLGDFLGIPALTETVRLADADLAEHHAGTPDAEVLLRALQRCRGVLGG